MSVADALRRLWPRGGGGALPAIPEGRRAYAIGDVHGRLDLLVELLARLENDHRARGEAVVTLVLLGDLIDRGPDSAGVVQCAMCPPAWADETVVLRGNHEAALLAALDGDEDMAALWLRNGGTTALESWGVDPAAIEALLPEEAADRLRAWLPAEQIAFLRACPLFHQLGDYHFVHAGIRPGVALDAQSDEDRLWIRAPFLASRADHGAVIVHGHTISEEAELRENRIGIDTGAYRYGMLTALGLDGTDRWLVQTGRSRGGAG